MASQTVSIIGLGLIGGSIALAVKQRRRDIKVIGFDTRPASLLEAQRRGAIDEAATSPLAAIQPADSILICVPPSAATSVLEAIRDGGRPGALVTDVLSTKRSITRSARELLRPDTAFVGSHPIAGSEKGGMEHARADLLAGALCVVTREPWTDPDARGRVEDFWTQLEMRVVAMPADQHDRFFSSVSHLPHAVAATLVNATDRAALALAGKGFADTTRVAGGNAELWRDILLSNADYVARDLRNFASDLNRLAEVLEGRRAQELQACLQRAAEQRNLLPPRPPQS